MRKLKKILKQKPKKQMITTFQYEKSGPSQEVEWYSDPGEEDELHSLDGSGSEKEIEAPKHPNENARITAKCKNETCNWRIHASPIQEGTTFQIKTVKGEHTCARSYVSKLAKAKYLGNRVEKVIRDNPNVPVSILKNTIMRKCNVDASKWKVIRAKRAALQKIQGLIVSNIPNFGITVR
ncbi:UNVERIFIED_CONTAM: hypothetical protein Sradi_0035400 [Sesamum radiatum]|uniref:Transposase MuDR plant domain-containing protein n=1 Tax=Sesamum radiatum TaxID=300843 RepID=A0AAW2WGJ7_SESRA